LACFYARRARRILPPYLLTLLVMTFFFGIAWATEWYWYLGLTNFLQPLRIPHPHAFDPLWSLAVEEQFYLVWPFAVYFLKERQLWKLAVALVLLAPLLRGVLHFPSHWSIYMLMPFRMDLLAVGALLCLAYRHAREKIERWGLPAAIVLCSFGLAGLLVLWQSGVSTYGNTRLGNVSIYEFALMICLGLMLWALSGKRVAWLTWRPLTYIGQISYSMYLVHLGVLILLTQHLSELAAGVLGFGLTVAYASLSWFVLERPLLSHSASAKSQVKVAVT